MRKNIIGVMGPGKDATEMDIKNAFILGELIARSGWILLSGGRNSGVMDSVNKGAKEKGGLTIGILPSDEKELISDGVDIPIITNMRSGRNYINVLSSDVIIACGMNPGTASEVALALNSEKQVILLGNYKESIDFFKKLGGKMVHVSKSPEEAVEITKKILTIS